MVKINISTYNGATQALEPSFWCSPSAVLWKCTESDAVLTAISTAISRILRTVCRVAKLKFESTHNSLHTTFFNRAILGKKGFTIKTSKPAVTCTSQLTWSFQDVVIDELQSRDQNFDWAHNRFFGGTRAWTVGQLILSKLPSHDFSDDVVLWVSAFVRMC